MSDQAEAAAPEAEGAVAESSADEPDEPQRPGLLAGLDLTAAARLARRVVPVVWIGAAIVTNSLWGVQVALLVLAAGALTLAIALMWSSVQSLTGGASLGFEEALGMGAPSKVEEQKRSVLRALKDLEYEKSVGKISTEDYQELSARYRIEAKRLIQSMDEALGPARQEVEAALEKRLTKAGIAVATPGHVPDPPAPDAPPPPNDAALPQPPAAEPPGADEAKS